MLVLSRHKGESVILSGGIKVVVVEIRGDKVRLGFEAPEDVTIHREEIWKLLESQGELDNPKESEA